MREAYPNELYHHGVKGQKWGIRRYQNADGSLTAAGKRRYYGDAPTKADKKEQKAAIKEIGKDRKSIAKNSAYLSDREIKDYIARLKLEKELRDLTKENTRKGNEYINNVLKDVVKEALKSGAKQFVGEWAKGAGATLASKTFGGSSSGGDKNKDKNKS